MEEGKKNVLTIFSIYYKRGVKNSLKYFVNNCPKSSLNKLAFYYNFFTCFNNLYYSNYGKIQNSHFKFL